MPYLVNMPDWAHDVYKAHGFTDDLDHLVSGDRWTTIDGDAGASVLEDADGVGGIVQLTTGATDNNEAYLHTSNELFLIAENKPLIVDCILQYAEASTDQANVMFGVMDGIAADALVNDDGGPKSSYSGAVFFKVGGQTLWQVESSDSTTQTTTTTAHTAGGTNPQALRIMINPLNATDAEVTFWFSPNSPNGPNDLFQCRENGANPRTPNIKHTLDYSNATEIAVVVGAKASSANSEVINVDMIQAYQKR